MFFQEMDTSWPWPLIRSVTDWYRVIKVKNMAIEYNTIIKTIMKIMNFIKVGIIFFSLSFVSTVSMIQVMKALHSGES